MVRFSWFILIVGIVARSSADVVTYLNCPGAQDMGTRADVEVRVTPCDPHGNGGCVLYKGSDVEIEIEFQSSNNSEALTHIVHGVFWNIKAPYVGLGNREACSKVEPSCPLVQNTTYTYKANFHVSTMYPAIPLTVQWQLVNDQGLEVCVQIPVKISNPKRN